MRYTITSALGALAALMPLAHAAPSGLETREVPCDDISMYTVQYWLDAQYLFPTADTCLFYTRGLTGDAQRFSDGTLYLTIWNFWACRYYDGRTDDVNNSLRCIFSNLDQKTQYFRTMSEAMARRCPGKSTVMTEDVNNIPQDGIWGQTEQPTLKRDPDGDALCTQINAFDKFGNNEITLWTRPAAKRSLGDVIAQHERRADGQCYSPEQLTDWFNDINW